MCNRHPFNLSHRGQLALPLALLIPLVAVGGEDRNRASDLSVIGAIYGDRHIPDSALRVHETAASLPVEARYEFLCSWVLPSSDHATFRLDAAFTTTHPVPTHDGQLKSAAPMDTQARRVQTGGELVSPALDLIKSAAALDRLDALRGRIETCAAPDELFQRCRLALLGLVDLTAGQYEQAAASFDELFARVQTRTYDDFAERWPETLAVHAGIRHARTREAAADMVYRMLQSQVRSGVARGPDAWDRWVAGTAGELTVLRALRDADITARQRSALDTGLEWRPVSKTTAWSRGHGLPCAAWLRLPGMVENVASHDEDYLYYRLPLRGNFEVECDVTGFGWRDSHLMVAGTYVAPVYDHVSYGLGTFRSARTAGVVTPRLSECDEWIRYRAVVADGACSTYFNGRLIHSESLAADHDPWLAIRSPWFTDGAVRNLRITGQPVIPKQLRLSVSSELTGWSPYFGEAVGGEAEHWRQRGDLAEGGGIVGRLEPPFHRFECERLLQYHRPMLEDGTIEYEFYYREGESLVHPAMDRRTFILDPHGIRIHWVTDGASERSTLSPSNLEEELQHCRGPRELPLRNSTWNRMRITLAGSSLNLTLNEQLVYKVELESTNQRTFGLFHWSDETEARVRNVVWTGDWPQQLPPVEEQELAGDGTRFLDQELPRLTAHFQLDFARDGLPRDRFLTESSSSQVVEASPDGVRVVVRGRQGYTPWWIGPNLQVLGDFDMRAEFENLQLAGTLDSSTGVYLMAITTDPETTHAGIYRGCLRKPNTHDRIITQAEFNRHKPTGASLTWPGTTAEEATSGTLRLARRGATIYCLFAESDSPNFRLIYTETVPPEPTRFDGVGLMSAIYSEIDGPCEVAVTWKRLSIWAEDLNFPTTN